jgi:hypothetical protein
MATTPSAIVRPQVTTAAPVVQDVALETGGTLRGQVLDQQGNPMLQTTVSVWNAGQEVASTQTDASGNFVVSNLRGGNYVVVAGEDGGTFRLWTETTAPPQARSGVLIVSGRNVRRAQVGGGFFTPFGLGMAGLIGGIIAGGVISQENSDQGGLGSGS